MKSVIIQPHKELWLPPRFEKKTRSIAVRFKTEIIDTDGRVIKTQYGHNEITDFGMDQLATNSQNAVINTLNLSSALGPAKRTASGGTTLTVVNTSPTVITVTASSNFFLVGDVGNTLSIDTYGQELKIVTFTSATVVVCSTRAGAFLPGVTPGTGPFSSYGVHFTSVSTLQSQFTKFATYDTSATNNDTELNDSGNSRTIHQRIFLSGAVSGSPWTVNQMGWSDGNAGNNCFGIANLASPDTIAIGQKYRVQLQLFSGYTLINIASQSVNWGATIGTYNLQILQEVVPMDSDGGACSFLHPALQNLGQRWTWFTGTFTIASVKWEGDSGYATNPHAGGTTTAGVMTTDSTYTGGQFFKTRTITFPDTVAVTAATGLTVGATTSTPAQILTIKPVTGTITKPSGFSCSLAFPIYWTRAFTN